MLSDHENGIRGKADLCTAGKLDYGPLSDLLSGAVGVPPFGREAGRSVYM